MPFSAGNSAGGGENFNHYGAIRIRVNGTGNLRPKFYGLDDVKTSTLAVIAMNNTPGNEPYKLANFINQRARLELKTTAVNEVFRINRITVWMKGVWTGAPNNG